MAKKTSRKNARQRRTERERQKQQRRQQVIIGAALFAALLVVAAVGLSSRGNVEPQVTERALLDPIRGNPNAPITLIEYGAFGCHACQQWHVAGIVDRLLEEFDGQVRFIFRDMPIISPSYDRRAAELAQCALDQSNEAFWSLHDVIYEEAVQGVSSNAELIALGESVGVDGAALRACDAANTHANTVLFDLQRGRELGIRATPTWLVNDRVVPGANPEALRQIIRQELAALG